MVRGQIEDTAKLHVPPESLEEQWDVDSLTTSLAAEYQVHAPIAEWMKSDSEMTDETLRERVVELALSTWQEREARYGAELMRQIERSLCCSSSTITGASTCRRSTTFGRASTFAAMRRRIPSRNTSARRSSSSRRCSTAIKQDVVKLVLTVQLRSEQDLQAVEEQESVSNVKYQHAGYDEALAATADDGDVAVATAAALHARRREGRPQRPVPVRLGQEVQALPRQVLTDAGGTLTHARRLPPPRRIAAARAGRRRSARRRARSRSGTATTSCSSLATRARWPRACSRTIASARRR